MNEQPPYQQGCQSTKPDAKEGFCSFKCGVTEGVLGDATFSCLPRDGLPLSAFSFPPVSLWVIMLSLNLDKTEAAWIVGSMSTPVPRRTGVLLDSMARSFVLLFASVSLPALAPPGYGLLWLH